MAVSLCISCHAVTESWLFLKGVGHRENALGKNGGRNQSERLPDSNRISIGAMKHPKHKKRAPQTHPSALAVPSYHRILVKHGLIEKTLSIPDAHKVFLKVGADPEVQKLRRKVAQGSKMKHVPA